MEISILGCGWLGMALGRKTAKKTGFKVKGSTTTPNKLEAIEKEGMQAFLVDLDTNCPNRFFQSDVIIITVPPSIPVFKDKIIKAIEQIKAAKVDKVIFISTTSVYPGNNREVKEADAEYLKSLHSGVTMLAIEDLFTAELSFKTTIIRFAGLYGPERHPGRFLAGKHNLKGANSPVNLIHQDDCIQIIIDMMEKGVWGETFNACADKHPTRKEFYSKAAASLGLQTPVFSDTPSTFKIVNSNKLKSLVGYKFIHPDPMSDIAI